MYKILPQKPIFDSGFGVKFVTTVGFEPTRPCEHQPLKLASLPFLHVADDF